MGVLLEYEQLELRLCKDERSGERDTGGGGGTRLDVEVGAGLLDVDGMGI